MKNLLFLSLIFISISSFAQKKSEIVQYGIEVKQFYEQDIEDGDKEPYLTKEEFYNYKGELVEVKEYETKSTDIDKWFKFKYDFEANLIEEIKLNSKGEQIERIEHKFEKGLKVEKLTFDEKDRLTKLRKYEYGIRK